MNATSHPARRDSIYHRLNHTPLRDILRGRLTGRLDVNRLLHDCGLPETLCDVVQRVVRKTRLTRFEKAGVARELATHFEDGLAAGTSATELAGDFGDVAMAAKLIRRAKKRSRPLAVKTVRRTVQAVGAVLASLVLVYVWFALRLFVAEPNVARNYVAEYNARIASIPEENRAWPLYRAAFIALGDDRSNTWKWQQDRPGSSEWSKCVALVENHAEELALLRNAARKPALGMFLNDEEDHRLLGGVIFSEVAPTLDRNPALYGLILPHPTVLQASARFLRIDAYDAMTRGDFDRAYSDIGAILRMVEHASEPRFLIDDLTAVAILQTGVELIDHLLYRHPEFLPDARLIELSHRLAGVRGGGPLWLHLKTEMAAFEDFLQRYYTDDGDGDGMLIVRIDELWLSDWASVHGTHGVDSAILKYGATPVLSALVAGRREMSERFDRHMDLVQQELRLPLWQRTRSQADAEMETLNDDRLSAVRYLPIAVLTPSLSRAGAMMELATQQRDAALVVLALELHKRRTGGYPTSLDALVPTLLPVVPTDRYDGLPIKYRLSDGRPQLYSVGVDRDDDGGRLAEGANAMARDWLPPDELQSWPIDSQYRRMRDGDWILWPPLDDAPQS